MAAIRPSAREDGLSTPRRSPAAGEIAALKSRLAELEATLDAIRSGAVDALVVSGPEGEQIFTLKGADESYRVLVEAMNEGAVTVGSDGTVLYANTRFAAMLRTPLEKVLGVPLSSFIALRHQQLLRDFLETSAGRNTTAETTLVAGDGSEISVLLSGNPLAPSTRREEEGVTSPQRSVPRQSGAADAICIVVTDITQRKIIEQARRDLSRNIVEAQENERQRVARELHDGVNQLLSSTKHRLYDIETQVKPLRPVRRSVIQVRNLVDRTIAEIRAISRNLRPSELDDLGLVAAMRTLGTEFTDRTGIRINLRLAKLSHPLTPQIELTIYRVFQECLANVEKHAQARRVDVELTVTGGNIVLQVVDNGRGIPERKVAGSHWGLINMRERASYVNGTLDLESKPGKGTRITLAIPL